MKSLRRKRSPAPRTAPPVAVPDALPLYAAMFPEMNVSPDSPTVQLHAAACGAAVSFVRGSWPPAVCSCPEGSGFPRTVATVADGDGPVDEVLEARHRASGAG